jgi:hypothetical protein
MEYKPVFDLGLSAVIDQKFGIGINNSNSNNLPM